MLTAARLRARGSGYERQAAMPKTKSDANTRNVIRRKQHCRHWARPGPFHRLFSLERACV
eukprot:950900-Pleurochrysis_carterae.AAC.11